MERKTLAVIALVVVVVVVVGAVAAVELSKSPSTPKAAKVTLSESGSTLLYPVFNAWKGNYSNATITTLSTGSGTGISSAIAGTVIIGASDAFMSPSLASANPGVMNIPIMISYQYIAYNIPNFNFKLNLSGNVIAGIFMGTINNWNNSLIQQLNPGVALPNHSIIPIHRSDGSGDTFMFTSFLSKSNGTWAQKVGAGTNVNWPSVAGSLTGNGNSGIITQMTTTPYSIGYIAATYEAQVNSAGFGIANLENQDGQFVGASVQNVSIAAQQYLPLIPKNGTIALQYAPGKDSYPIADMEYVIVRQNQSSPAIASALKEFLNWAVSSDGGSSSKYLTEFNLVPLPSSVVSEVVIPLINKITG